MSNLTRGESFMRRGTGRRTTPHLRRKMDWETGLLLLSLLILAFVLVYVSYVMGWTPKAGAVTLPPTNAYYCQEWRLNGEVVVGATREMMSNLCNHDNTNDQWPHREAMD